MLEKKHPYKQFVFEGGGVKGIGFLGALQQFEKTYGPRSLNQIERVAGASAGAIMALFMGLNFTLKEMEHVLWSLDFNKFKDDSWGIVRDSARVVKHYGLFKGDFFESWINELIEAKTGNGNITFGEFKKLMLEHPEKGFKQMYFMGTNLSKSREEVFSCGSKECERLPLATAVRISMSIPVFFAAPRLSKDAEGYLYRDTSGEGDVYSDGGVLNNYPIKLFDASGHPNNATLGFRLDSEEEIQRFRDGLLSKKSTDISSLFGYANALVKVFYQFQDHEHARGHDRNRTVYIDTLGVSTTDFDLTDSDKKALIDSGEKAVKNFLQRVNPSLGTNTTGGSITANPTSASASYRTTNTFNPSTSPLPLPNANVRESGFDSQVDDVAVLQAKL